MASKKQTRPLNERHAIALLERALTVGPLPDQVRLGIGDDAAVLSCSAPLVWSIDSSVEGVHFDLRWLSLGQAAARAISAAVSDLAAMGADPVAALCNVQLPRQCTEAQVREIAKFQSRMTRRLSCPIIGGNLSRGAETQFTTTVLGQTPRPLLRSGARPGDEVWLLGAIGEAAAGLGVLQRAFDGPRKRHWRALLSGAQGDAISRAARRCVGAWRAPRARVGEGLTLRAVASGCLDVSDGLAADAGHLARASGVSVVLNERALQRRLSPALRTVASELQLDPLGLALGGGEDYALLATGQARDRPRGAKPIGTVESGTGLHWQDGKALTPGGFDHLA